MNFHFTPNREKSNGKGFGKNRDLCPFWAYLADFGEKLTSIKKLGSVNF